MRLRSLILAAALTAAAPPLMAEVVSGSTEIETRRGTASHVFTTDIDTEAGSFHREGTITFFDGTSGHYAIDGTCDAERGLCLMSGTGLGPMGANWTGTGRIEAETTNIRLVADLTADNGRSFKLRRVVERAGFPELALIGLAP